MFNIRHTGRKSLLAVIFCISLGALLPLTGWSANLLQNDGLEPPFTKYGTYTVPGKTFDLEVAHDWNRYFIAAGTPDSGQRFYFFRSSALEFLYGFTEKRDGVDAQVFWSTDPFDGGIYQQLSGLTVGEHYGFQAGTLQVYANTTSKTHNMMFRSVGIDPTGGTDPGSPNVVWSPEEGRDVAWFYPGVGATAKSPTMTVFVRIRSPRDAPPLEENSVWVDDTYFDIAPQTSLSLSLDSTTQATASWNGTPRVGYSLYAYEAQYRKTTDTDWTDLQVFASNVAKSTATSRSFTVEPGAEYVVRARTWHEQIGGDSHEIPGPWAEATIVSGGLVRGKVLNNLAQPVNGATVQVSGFPLTSTTTSSAGDF